MRTKAAVIIAILCAIALHFVGNKLSDYLHLQTYIDFGDTVTVTRGSGPYSYDEEIDGAVTDLGYFITAISIMVGWRVYRWVLTGTISGELTKKQEITWRTWFFGLVCYTVLTTPIHNSNISSFFKNFISMAIGAATAYIFYQIYQKSLQKAQIDL